MYVDTATKVNKSGKSYKRYLLRSSYRENGKVKHKTIANISSCTDAEIEAIKLALKHKNNLDVLTSIKNIKHQQGKSIGAVFVLKEISDRLGITKALGNIQVAVLTLWMVFTRIIDQGSRLSAVRLAQTHAVCDVLNIEKGFSEDDLYMALDWVCKNQSRIENTLLKSRTKGEAVSRIYLYDVTSSYFEGNENELAEYGYNRDKKKGKKQIVIGLLTDKAGCPVSIEVFRGNTPDQTTVPEQIEKLKKRFGSKYITLVGDRGMLKTPQQEDLNDEYYNFITAISKPQIEKMIKDGIIQLALFDEDLVEIEDGGIRYILRRNPIRQKEIENNRIEKELRVRKFIENKNNYLLEHKRAKVDVAVRNANNYVNCLKLNKYCRISFKERELSLEINEEAKKETGRLDGCYVIKTDLPTSYVSSDEVHDRYKDLCQVERAFRSIKTDFLEVRPIYLRNAERTKGHVFVTMLSYMITRYLKESWKYLDLTVEEGIKELSTISSDIIQIGDKEINKIPKPRNMGQQLLAALDLKLPEGIEHKNVKVATRKKLVDRRK